MDFDRVHKLLNILDLSRHWPQLANIHNAALAELMNLAKTQTVKPNVKPADDLRAEGTAGKIDEPSLITNLDQPTLVDRRL